MLLERLFKGREKPNPSTNTEEPEYGGDSGATAPFMMGEIDLQIPPGPKTDYEQIGISHLVANPQIREGAANAGQDIIVAPTSRGPILYIGPDIKKTLLVAGIFVGAIILYDHKKEIQEVSKITVKKMHPFLASLSTRIDWIKSQIGGRINK